MSPDGHVYFELVDGTSGDSQAARLSPDLRTIPLGIDWTNIRRFRREPTYMELAVFMAAALTAADRLYVQQAQAAGAPAAAPAGGGAIIHFPRGGASAAAGGSLAVVAARAPSGGLAGPRVGRLPAAAAPLPGAIVAVGAVDSSWEAYGGVDGLTRSL